MVVSRSIYTHIFSCLAGIILALLAVHIVAKPDLSGRENDLTDHSASGTYRFTNPLLACGDIDSLSVGSMEQLRDQITDVVDGAIKNGSIVHAAVYIRDLDNGPWMGLHEKEFFYPASLLKVPLLLAAYREEESRPGFMERSILFKAPLVNASYLYPPQEELERGSSYKVAELLRRAISYSDNEAAALLGNAIGFGKLTKVFGDFGIEEPAPGKDYQMRVRTYASFFRVLYNASYINREHSEEALKLLSENDFKDGIVGGVPVGIVVAHKFGEREGTVENGNVQLHDCGIVYAPGKPYLLCIMAQGKTTGGILDIMRRISAKTYATMIRS